LNDKVIFDFHNNVDTTVLVPRNANNPLGVLTSDGRPCIVQPSDLPTPGQIGAPPEPNYSGTAPKKVNRNNVESQNQIQTQNIDKKELDSINSNKKVAEKIMDDKGQSAGSDKATCLMLAQDLYQNKGTGEVITDAGDFSKTGKKVTCPAFCFNLTDGKMQIFGPSKDINNKKSSRIYTLDTSICGAAIHSGVIDNLIGGDVILHLTKDSGEGFMGKYEYNLISNESNGTGIAFYMDYAPKPVILQCQDTAEFKLKKTPGKKQNFKCLKGCYSYSKRNSA